MEKIKMTKTQFVEFVKAHKGCSFISVTAITDADMYLKGNPFRGRVKKLTITPMQFGYDYEKAVNNRLVREGKEPIFTADKLPWGRWVNAGYNKVIEHNDEYYLRTYCVRNARPKTFYLLDGVVATKEEYAEFSKWFKPSSVSEKQTACGLEEEFQVKPRNFKFSNIVAVTINHTRVYLED